MNLGLLISMLTIVLSVSSFLDLVFVCSCILKLLFFAAEFEECDNVDIAAVINSEQWSEDNYDDFIEDELEREEEMEDLERAENGGSDVDEDISEDEVNSTDLEGMFSIQTNFVVLQALKMIRAEQLFLKRKKLEL